MRPAIVDPRLRKLRNVSLSVLAVLFVQYIYKESGEDSEK
jgi:hypothetical protein